MKPPYPFQLATGTTRARIWVALLILGTFPFLAACGGDDITSLPEANYTPSALPFLETFANNSRGWSLGPEWAIGPATAHTPTLPGTFSSDPGTDVTPSADNGIAGVVLGGEYSTVALHGYYYLTSPPVDTTSATGPLSFSYYRWLNSDYPNYITNRVEVFDGANWIVLWQQPANAIFINESSWTPYSFDVTAYSNPALQVRFGFQLGDLGVGAAGGWNVDDVLISD